MAASFLTLDIFDPGGYLMCRQHLATMLGFSRPVLALGTYNYALCICDSTGAASRAHFEHVGIRSLSLKGSPPRKRVTGFCCIAAIVLLFLEQCMLPGLYLREVLGTSQG